VGWGGRGGDSEQLAHVHVCRRRAGQTRGSSQRVLPACRQRRGCVGLHRLQRAPAGPGLGPETSGPAPAHHDARGPHIHGGAGAWQVCQLRRAVQGRAALGGARGVAGGAGACRRRQSAGVRGGMGRTGCQARCMLMQTCACRHECDGCSKRGDGDMPQLPGRQSTHVSSERSQSPRPAQPARPGRSRCGAWARPPAASTCWRRGVTCPVRRRHCPPQPRRCWWLRRC
jgi:hypothetical protein